MFPSLMAYFIIPAYTLLFVSQTDWFSLNLSVIGNQNGASQAFLLLGILIGAYYHIVLGRVISALPSPKRARRLLTASLLLLIFAVSTPYLPSRFPVRSLLHVVAAFTAATLLLACLYLVVWQLSAGQPHFAIYRLLLLSLTIICAILLILVGIVSTALEVVFLLGSTTMVEKLYARCFPRRARHG